MNHPNTHFKLHFFPHLAHCARMKPWRRWQYLGDMISRMLEETMVVVADMFNIKSTHSVSSPVYVYAGTSVEFQNTWSTKNDSYYDFSFI